MNLLEFFNKYAVIGEDSSGLYYLFVTNHTYGGFSIDEEIANHLKKHYGWKESTVFKDPSAELYRYSTNGISWSDTVFPNEYIRLHREFIETILTLKEQLGEVPYNQRYQHQCLNLTVNKIELNLFPSLQVYDGKETVNDWGEVKTMKELKEILK